MKSLLNMNYYLITISCCLMFNANSIFAQDINLGLSTTHDENIFDIYYPIKDQITQAEIDVSKDWDIDNASLNFSYDGSLYLFRDLTTRNHYLHYISFNTDYKFNDENNELDSSASADSALQFLSVILRGMAQFNKVDFEDWDHSLIGGSVVFRQPLGPSFAIWPMYTLAYYHYPNLSFITNVQNCVSFQLGTDALEGSWFDFIPAYTYKHYPLSQTDTDTILVPKPGHGGHGGLIKKAVIYNTTTPSVQQFSSAFTWKYMVMLGTEILTRYTYYALPSASARVALELQQGHIESNAFLGEAQNSELIDDHLSYSGDEIECQVKQTLLYDMILTINGHYQKKTFTFVATNSEDSVTANNRLDYRGEITVNLTKAFPELGDKNIQVHLEYHYLGNNSNSFYFNFKKNTFMVGFEYSF